MPTKRIRYSISNIHLQGFKSIENLKIDINKGLNILIGKNASGKSNFLEFLNEVLKPKNSNRTNYKFSKIEFTLSNGDVMVWETEREVQLHNIDMENRFNSKEKLFVNDKVVFASSKDSLKQIKYSYLDHQFRLTPRNFLNRIFQYGLTPLFIKFNIPDELDCIKQSGKLEIFLIKNGIDFWEVVSTLNFLQNLFFELEVSYADDVSKLQSVSVSNFYPKLKIKDEIKFNLKKFTPIQDLRFNKSIRIYKSEKSIIIDSLILEFKVNNLWIPWSQLSDGTKRLFCIVAEITDKEEGVVLLEEPELGVHPHQFNLIMDFLKEESRNKQIIISTHSPQALNHLNEDELTNILVTKYDMKKKTQIKHLTNAEINKAKRYMKEVGFFSDYWMLSDLE